MTHQHISKRFDVELAEDFIRDVKELGCYYIYAARHIPYTAGDSPVPDTQTAEKDVVVDVYDNLMFGKKVEIADVNLMIPRYDWITDTAYDQYDDTDTVLYTKNFYVSVNVGSQMHVYKCLYNNFGANSTVEPAGTDPNPFYSPEDNYIWKYMYTANDYVMRKFATNDYIPLVANSDVTLNARPGAIDAIVIEDKGLGYNNYHVGTFASALDIRIDGNPLVYAIGPSLSGAAPSNIDNFYTGCIIRITSGNAKNEYAIINNYYIDSDTGQRIIALSAPFVGTIVPSDTFEIYPYIYVFDTGETKTANCIARAIISPTQGNCVSFVEILEPGAGYRKASAMVIANPAAAPISNSSLRVVIPPPGGHGYKIDNELGANRAGLVTKFIENEAPIRGENDYRVVGIIKDPLFANVNIKTANSVGSFTIDENVYQYTPVNLVGAVDTTLDSSSVVGTGTTFSSSLKTGDSVLISSGTQNIFATIASITDDSSITISKTAAFSANDCSIALVKDATAKGKLTAAALDQITLTDFSVSGLTDSVHFVGEDSSATTKVDTSYSYAERITINGRAYESFKAFRQMRRYIGNLQGETQFIADETVTAEQEATFIKTTARYHSFTENGTSDELYVTNITQSINPTPTVGSTGIIVGSTSGALFTVTAKYDGDLVQDSGEILYIENLSPISRSNTQTETVKLILEF